MQNIDLELLERSIKRRTITEENMNGFVAIVIAAALGLYAATYSGNATVTGSDEVISNQNGPAPNSGDGIPDGSGNDAPFGPVGGK